MITDVTSALGDPGRLSSAVRLRALDETGLMDAVPDESFDRLVRVVARAVDVPVALISLVDDVRQFFISSTGLAEPWASRRETSISDSICQHVVTTDRPFLVTDATRDGRLATSLAVVERGVVAYAGIPLRAPDGETVGALCAIDERPRNWTDEELETLQVLSRAVSSEIALRLAATRQRSLVSQARHRLGTPLTALLVQLDYVAGRSRLDPELDEQLEHARTQARRLADELDRLVADTSSGSFGHEDGVDLMDMLTEAAARWSEAVRAQDREFRVEPHPPLHIRTSAAALRDVLDVLIHTAVEHGQGAISLAGRQDAHTLRIRIAFGDPGLPPATLARLLERRDHEHPDHTEEPSSLAETIALRLGGRLVVTSATPKAIDLVLAQASRSQGHA